MTRYIRFDTPFGPMLAAARDEQLVALQFEESGRAGGEWREEPACALLRACRQQVLEYLDGRRRRFELPLAASGTPFQRRAWSEIARIAYGESATYTEIARRCGAPLAARAVGAAAGRNPLLLLVPCHRVLGCGGALAGYAGGLARKRHLLDLESAARRVAA